MSNPIIVIMGDSTAAGIGANANAMASWIQPNCVTIAASGHRIDQVQTDWTGSAYYGNANIVAVIVCAVLNDIANKDTLTTINSRKTALIASIRAGTPANTPILWNAPNAAKGRWSIIGFSALDIATAYQTQTDFTTALVTDASNHFYAIKDHVSVSDDGSGNLLAKYNYADDGIHPNDPLRQIQAEFNVTQLRALRISASVVRGRLDFGSLGAAQTRQSSLDASIGNPRNGTTTVGALGAGKILIDSRSRPFLSDSELRAMIIGP